MHIAFVSLGAFGHINPTLALVTELVKRGVRVTYFTTEAFRRIIEPTGAKFVPVPSWMAENDKHNKGGEKKEDDGGVAAAVPFLFLNEAGAYIDTVLDTLKNDKPDAIVHDFAGIAGTIAADSLKVPNVMLHTSYPSNTSYSVAAGFENVPADHPFAPGRGPAGSKLRRKIRLPPDDRQGNLRRPRGLQPGHDAEKVGSQLRDFR